MRFLVDECTGPAIEDERAVAKITTLARLLDGYEDRLVDAFVVVTETLVRFRRA